MKTPAVALPLGLLLLLALPARGQHSGDHADSSMLAWAGAVAEALTARLPAAVSRADVHYTSGRGVNPRKVEAVFRAHLTSALRAQDVGTGGTRVDVTISMDGARMWAVGVLDTEPAAAFAVSWPIDRELEALLGAKTAGTGSARWRLERLGTVPAGVLDVALVDLDGDGSDDIATLSVDGIRTFRFDTGDARPTPLGGPFAFPSRDWPRTIAGRLVADGGSLVAATTAGHRVRVDPSSGSVSNGPSVVPLLQPPDPAWPRWLGGEWVLDGPNLTVPNVPLPALGVRDLQRFPGTPDDWLWIDAEGQLGGHGPAGPWSLEGALPFGDRVVLVELEGEGQPELVTTGAVPLGEADHVTIHRLEGTPPRASVLFRSTFAGTVRALGSGDLDFDGRPDMVLVEEDGSNEAVLWRLERSP